MTLIAKILLKITLKRLTPIEMFPKSLIRKGMFFKRMMLIELTNKKMLLTRLTKMLANWTMTKGTMIKAKTYQVRS